jgi:hypothetical protein
MSKTKGALGGAATGAASGAVLGSIVPGIGTAIGAGVGAGIGGIAGWLDADKEEKEVNKAQQRKETNVQDVKNITSQIPSMAAIQGVQAQAPVQTQNVTVDNIANKATAQNIQAPKSTVEALSTTQLDKQAPALTSVAANPAVQAQLKAQEEQLQAARSGVQGIQTARTAQEQAQELARKQATGEAPSFAEILMQRNLEKGLKQQMAASAAQPWSAAAQRNLQNQAIEQQQAMAQDIAGLRAQEQAQAISSFGQLAASTAATSVQEQQARQANASTALQASQQAASMSSQDIQNKMQAMDNDAKNQLNLAAQQIQARGLDQEMAYKVAYANQQKELAIANMTKDIDIQNASNTLNAALSNQKTNLTAELDKAARGDAAALANMQKELQLAGLNQQQALAVLAANLRPIELAAQVEAAAAGKPAQPGLVDKLLDGAISGAMGAFFG